MDVVEVISEYPQNGIKNKGLLGTISPSRFKLSMYKKNLVLDAPRKQNLTLKMAGDTNGTYQKRVFSTEKKQGLVGIDKHLTNYASVRPGPRIIPSSYSKLSIKGQ